MELEKFNDLKNSLITKSLWRDMKRSKQKTSSVQFDVLGTKWRAVKTKPETVRRKFGPNAPANLAAYSDFANSHIYFSSDSFTLHNVRHEVVHLLFDSLCLDTTYDITLNDLEEIVCEFAATHVDTIRKVSMEIFKGLRQ